MRFAELVSLLGGSASPGGGGGPEITGVHLESQRVGAGDLFLALRGTRDDGARFVRDARARGALAVLAEAPIAAADLAGLPLWVHPEARRIAGLAARAVYGDPGAKMFVAAVTGTNGKTTTAHLAAQLLGCGGARAGVLGTAGNRLADGELRSATHTTPDAPELQRLLREHARLGGTALVLEASSHALSQERLSGVRVDTALFTNLTRDHLDYHGDLDSYARARGHRAADRVRSAQRGRPLLRAHGRRRARGGRGRAHVQRQIARRSQRLSTRNRPGRHALRPPWDGDLGGQGVPTADSVSRIEVAYRHGASPRTSTARAC